MAKNKGAPDDGAASSNPESETLENQWQGLIADAKQAASTEAKFQISRASAAGKVVGKIAALAVLALVLLFFVLMAVVVGLLLALAHPLGAWGALGAVVGGLVLAMALSGAAIWLAVRRLKRMLAIGKASGDAA